MFGWTRGPQPPSKPRIRPRRSLRTQGTLRAIARPTPAAAPQPALRRRRARRRRASKLPRLSAPAYNRRPGQKSAGLKARRLGQVWRMLAKQFGFALPGLGFALPKPGKLLGGSAPGRTIRNHGFKGSGKNGRTGFAGRR